MIIDLIKNLESIEEDIDLFTDESQGETIVGTENIIGELSGEDIEQQALVVSRYEYEVLNSLRVTQYCSIFLSFMVIAIALLVIKKRRVQ